MLKWLSILSENEATKTRAPIQLFLVGGPILQQKLDHCTRKLWQELKLITYVANVDYIIGQTLELQILRGGEGGSSKSPNPETTVY